MTALVDVVVVSFNSAPHLATCLESLAMPAVVVDNASDDESAGIARAHGAAVIRNGDNVGFARAANQGARVGSAPFVLFLNPDAVIDADSVTALVAAIRRDDLLAAVAPGRVTLPDGTAQRVQWPYPSPLRSAVEAFGLHAVLRPPPGFLIGTCLLVRRSAFETTGGFDEQFWLYGEEADLCRRLEQLGWRLAVVDGVVISHVGGASGATVSDLAFEQFQRGAERFIRKHHGAGGLFVHRLALFSGSVIRTVLLGLHAADRSKAAHRTRIARRLFRVLLTHPLSLPDPPEESPWEDIVLFSLETWDEIWRRNQFLVRELLRDNPLRRVLFVEPPFDVMVQRKLRWRSRAQPSTELERLWLHRPIKVLPRVAGPWADALLRRSVRRAMATVGFTKPVLWINDASYAGVRSWGLPIVCDITDDWTEASGPTRSVARYRQREQALLRAADEVVVCSAELAKSKARLRQPTLIPNAVDVEHFRLPRSRPVDLPPGPTVVYVGSLHDDRLDVALVDELATTLDEAHIVLVGPNSLSPASRARLAALPNVELIGARPYEDVPAYYQHADVIVVPHVVSPFTESLDPIKGYEILAVQKRAVVTPLPGLVGLGDNVIVAARDAFTGAVVRALETPERAASPATVPSWADRAAVAVEVLLRVRQRTRRLRVVYLGHTAVLSGAELALARLLPALRDVEPLVILGEDGPLVEKLQSEGIAVEVLPMPAAARTLHRDRVRPGGAPLIAVLRTTGYVFRLARRLRELRPDLIHANTLKACLYGCAAARLAGVPAVWHARDRVADDYLPKAAVRLVRLAVRTFPAAVIANSRTTLDTLRLRRGLAGIIASPVIHDPATTDRRQRRRPSESLTFCMLGRIAPWKGQDLFLRALARAFPDGGVRAIIAGAPMFGEDAFGDALHELVDQLHLEDVVTFAGFVSDVSGLLSTVDVLVHASLIPEPFGQVIIEGMAAGLVVVAADAGGPREVITHERDGVLFTPGSIEELAAALGRVATDPSLRKGLGDAAHIRAQDFTPDRIAAEVRALYDKLSAR